MKVDFSKIEINSNDKGEKLCSVIAVGYGKTQGVMHKVKPSEEVCDSKINPVPEWFANGVKAALLAPTAMNQQNFILRLRATIRLRQRQKAGSIQKWIWVLQNTILKQVPATARFNGRNKGSPKRLFVAGFQARI